MVKPVILFTGTIIVSTLTPVLLQDFNITNSLNNFALDLFTATNNQATDNINIALSTLSIWTVLSIISEGAQGHTLEELNKVLGLPQDKNLLRTSYQKLSKVLEEPSDGAEFDTSNGIFVHNGFQVKEQFLNVAKQFYNISTVSVDFKKNLEDSAAQINKYIETATKGRIPELVHTGDIQNAAVFLTSTMFFKGQWQVPFNKSATQRASFFDEKKNKIGDVSMMYQFYPYPFLRFDKLQISVLELPYGFDDKYSMVILLPRGTQTIDNLLQQVKKDTITNILTNLRRNHQKFSGEDIHVYLPKFKIVSDFNLDVVLETLGITDIFNSEKADLLGMFYHYLYLSRVIHKAEIEVDEEGTIASAASGTAFLNRAPPPHFNANRPFMYLIVHKPSSSAIFVGRVSNPNTLL